VKKVTGLGVLMSELPSKLFLCSTWPDGMIVNKNCFVAPLLLYILRATKPNPRLSYWILISPKKGRTTKNHFHFQKITFLLFPETGLFLRTVEKLSCALSSELHSCVTKTEAHFPKRAGVNTQKCLDKAVTLDTIVKHPVLLLVHAHYLFTDRPGFLGKII
jgi:hypothetical protein